MSYTVFPSELTHTNPRKPTKSNNVCVTFGQTGALAEAIAKRVASGAKKTGSCSMRRSRSRNSACRPAIAWGFWMNLQSSYDWSPRKTVWAHASRPRSIPSEKPGRMVASSICLFRLGSAALFALGNPIARDPNRVDAMHILDIDQWIVREDD